jgi:hypothetical protein
MLTARMYSPHARPTDKPIGKGSTHVQDRKQIVHQRHKCTANNYVKTEDMADGWSGI